MQVILFLHFFLEPFALHLKVLKLLWLFITGPLANMEGLISGNIIEQFFETEDAMSKEDDQEWLLTEFIWSENAFLSIDDHVFHFYAEFVTFFKFWCDFLGLLFFGSFEIGGRSQTWLNRCLRFVGSKGLVLPFFAMNVSSCRVVLQETSCVLSLRVLDWNIEPHCID